MVGAPDTALHNAETETETETEPEVTDGVDAHAALEDEPAGTDRAGLDIWETLPSSLHRRRRRQPMPALPGPPLPSPRPWRFRAAVAADLRLDRRTGEVRGASPTADPERHLRALGGRALSPGHLFGPGGELRRCDRVRLPWFDVGFARDGAPLVVVNTPAQWSDQAVADVLGVGTVGGPDIARWLDFGWTEHAPRREACQPFPKLASRSRSVSARAGGRSRPAWGLSDRAEAHPGGGGRAPGRLGGQPARGPRATPGARSGRADRR